MFRGFSHHNIDGKGRLIIPSRFKELIQNGDRRGVMLSRLDGCLVAFPYDQWEKIEQKILSLQNKSDKLRRFRRIFMGGAFDCECDKQSRILIPPPLREYAKLQKEIVLVGVLDHFEIWSKPIWEQEFEMMDQDMQDDEFKETIDWLGL